MNSNISSSTLNAGLDLRTKVSAFDDFLGMNFGSGIQGQLGLQFTGVAGGGQVGVANVVQTAGRPGIAAVQLGTTSNATATGLVLGDMFQAYAGVGEVTLQWAAKMPATLSDATNEYVISMGFINTTAASASTNAIVIEYKRTVSTNFCARTSKGGDTVVTTLDSTNFAVVVDTWYTFKIHLNAAGTLVSFYVAPVGGDFVLLGTSAATIPDISNRAYLGMSIYRASTNAQNRLVHFDWIQIDVNCPTAR